MTPCAKCMYWLAEPASAADAPAQGMCRRYPPVPLAVPVQVPPSPANPRGGMGVQVVSQFPPTLATAACGEALMRDPRAGLNGA